eukprot:g77341.t1
MFANGLGHCIFSLDEIDTNLPFNPMQLLHFAPAALRNTRMLALMFHADYILKFLTCGLEISADPPFLFRPTTAGLLKGVAAPLVAAVNVCVDSAPQENKAHRFWINAGGLPVQMDENDNYVEVALGRLEMCVKKQLMVRDPQTGELKDAPVDSDDTSPEGLFARNCTQHYEALGVYFPVLMQLRELAKIEHAVDILQAMRQHVDERIAVDIPSQRPERARMHGEHLTETLAKASTEFNDMNVESRLSDLCSRQHIPYRQYDEVRGMIRNALNERNNQMVHSIVTQLADRVGVASYSLTNEVRTNLRLGH